MRPAALGLVLALLACGAAPGNGSAGGANANRPDPPTREGSSRSDTYTPARDGERSHDSGKGKGK